jgi:hypothetical protein
MKRENHRTRNGRAHAPDLSPEQEVSLRPLREIGSTDKSAHWEFEDVQAALRTAYRLGLPPERLFFRGVRRRRAG